MVPQHTALVTQAAVHRGLKTLPLLLLPLLLLIPRSSTSACEMGRELWWLLYTALVTEKGLA